MLLKFIPHYSCIITWRAQSLTYSYYIFIFTNFFTPVSSKHHYRAPSASKSTFPLPITRTNHSKFNIRFCGPLLTSHWCMKSLSIVSFKQKLKKHIIANYWFDFQFLVVLNINFIPSPASNSAKKCLHASQSLIMIFCLLCSALTLCFSMFSFSFFHFFFFLFFFLFSFSFFPFFFLYLVDVIVIVLVCFRFST